MAIKGFEKLVDAKTGEEYTVLMNEIDVGDVPDLNKVFLKQMISLLNFRYKQLEVATWIIDNLDSEYCIYESQYSISDKLGCGFKTVYSTLKNLQDAKILEKIMLNRSYNGYKVNPLLICKDKNINSLCICYKINKK